MRADPLLQFGRISLDPAEDGGVIHLDTAIQQHQLEVAVADWEHQIPSHRPQDHLGGELPAFEGLILPDPHRLSLSRHASAILSPGRRHKLATESQYRPDWKLRSDFRPMKLLAKYEPEHFRSGRKCSKIITKGDGAPLRACREISDP